MVIENSKKAVRIFSIRMDEETDEKLRWLAKQEQRTRGNMIRVLINRAAAAMLEGVEVDEKML